MKKLIAGALLSVSIANAFSIRTNPPISMSGFTCQCSVSLCDCKRGNINVSVVPRSEYYIPDRAFMGETCAERCLLRIGDVVGIEFPALSVSEMREAERSISQSIRNSMSTQQKMSLMLSSLKEKAADIPFVGKLLQGDDEDKLGDISVEKTKTLLKEKAVSKLERQARQANVDMSGYIVLKTAKLWWGDDVESRYVYKVFKDESIKETNTGMLLPVLITLDRLSGLQMKGKLTKFYEYFILIESYPDIVKVLPFEVYANTNIDIKKFLLEQKDFANLLLKSITENKHQTYEGQLQYVVEVLATLSWRVAYSTPEIVDSLYIYAPKNGKPVFLDTSFVSDNGAINIVKEGELAKKILQEQIQTIDKILKDENLMLVLNAARKAETASNDTDAEEKEKTENKESTGVLYVIIPGVVAAIAAVFYFRRKREKGGVEQ